MADPQKYQRSYSFSNYQATNPSRPLPGPRVDDELENIGLALGQSIDAIKDIRRSDGVLKNGIVTVDTLHPSLAGGFAIQGLWKPDTRYLAGDSVIYGSKLWRARVTHVSVAGEHPSEASSQWEMLLDVVVGDPANGSVTAEKLADYFTLDVSTVAVAKTLVIPAGVGAIRTAGHAVPGDGGGALYRRAADQPYHPGKFQTPNGAWWELMRSEVTPEMFGAKRDGATDDGPAILAACQYVSAKGGGVVQCLAGTYRVDTRIEPPDFVTLRGAGHRQTVLKAKPAGITGQHMFFVDRKTNVGFENLVLIGNRGTAAPEQNTHGISAYGTTNLRVTDCTILNILGYGIGIFGSIGYPSTAAVVEKCTIENTFTGITCFKNAIGAWISKNTINTCESHGILIDDATTNDNPSNTDPFYRPVSCFRVFIDKNVITNTAQTQWAAGIGASAVNCLKITNNVIWAVGNATAGGTGIIVNSGQAFFAPSEDVTIEGNLIRDALLQYGIQMQGVWRGTVKGNVVHSCGYGAGGGPPLIYVKDDDPSGKHTNGIAVEGNSLGGNGFSQTGVHIGAGVANCTVGPNVYQTIITEIVNDSDTTNKKVSLITA